MRTVFLIIAAVAATSLGLLWITGGFDQLAGWATTGQRSFQNEMARTLRALRTGDTSAFITLMSVCFAYGFFHAVGPGHGKILIGGYGLGSRVAMLRLSGIALLSSLAQGLTAIIVVYAGITLLDLSLRQMVSSAERLFAPISYGAIALVGLWLFVRGLRKIWRPKSAHPDTHGHDHSGDAAHCDSCGHRHGPSMEESENISSMRDLVLLVGAIAIRPCTGAIFLLILTWRYDLVTAGIAGTFAMALGTASVMIAVAIASTLLRNTTLRGVSGGVVQHVVPALEITAGLIVALSATQLLVTAL